MDRAKGNFAPNRALLIVFERQKVDDLELPGIDDTVALFPEQRVAIGTPEINTSRVSLVLVFDCLRKLANEAMVDDAMTGTCVREGLRCGALANVDWSSLNPIGTASGFEPTARPPQPECNPLDLGQSY
ncbi:hypothetical protein PsorP6_010774 [Peronosclerospora sorghi]|uniref:Uncharacterized protein n=1 Tax=Peronosclerospora sorghi TaxID=230839 RepID=A0ACC0VWR6_9STRA|nr:hypothetical protein PsorP6_010774 [Peronosclerospora sorghi]